MKKTPDDDVRKLAELHYRSTPGPWKKHKSMPSPYSVNIRPVTGLAAPQTKCGKHREPTFAIGGEYCNGCTCFDKRQEALHIPRNEADMDFIAAAHATVPLLLAEIEQYRRAFEKIKKISSKETALTPDDTKAIQKILARSHISYQVEEEEPSRFNRIARVLED